MKYISIKNSQKMIIVDDEDYDRLVCYSWYLQPRSHSVQRRDYSLEKSNISIASDVMQKLGYMYDHIDGNPLNNQKSNLRRCTYSTNAMNRKKIDGTVSKYKGVSWSKQHNKWMAKIGINGSRIYLGLHDSEEEAAMAYNRKAVELFKEFANLNKISSDALNAKEE